MPDERIITEIEQILTEIVELGAEKERTKLVPNLLVTNASPSGLSNFIIVRDDRDGDNILATKVPGIIYNTSDLVNVLFVKGGEAIAFQQGSASTSSDIWGIVLGSSTDIFYNAGDVVIGKTTAPDATLEILDASQSQLRLTHTDATKFTDFTLDTNHDLTIDPSSTGQIILASPDVVIEEDLIHSGDTDTKISFTDDRISFDAGAINLLRLTETTQDLVEIGDVAGAGDVDINFNNGQAFIQGSDGNIGFGTITPGTDRVSFQGPSGANLAVGFYTGDGDGTDFASLVMYGVGTPGSIVNRERLILQYDRVNLKMRIQSEAGGTGTLRPMSFEVGSNTDQLRLDTAGNIGLSVASPSTRLDMGAGAIEMNEMTAPGGGAVNTARLYAVDNGAGKTQLVVIFNTGAAQVLATQP